MLNNRIIKGNIAKMISNDKQNILVHILLLYPKSKYLLYLCKENQTYTIHEKNNLFFITHISLLLHKQRRIYRRIYFIPQLRKYGL